MISETRERSEPRMTWMAQTIRLACPCKNLPQILAFEHSLMIDCCVCGKCCETECLWSKFDRFSGNGGGNGKLHRPFLATLGENEQRSQSIKKTFSFPAVVHIINNKSRHRSYLVQCKKCMKPSRQDGSCCGHTDGARSILRSFDMMTLVHL